MRIWFNHWFSTAYHLLHLMGEGETDFHMIGSGTNPNAIYRMACEEWYEEPAEISDEEYVSFCLDFCRLHQVDLFVPRRKLAAISRNYHRFAQAGVKVMADADEEMISILDDKEDTYRFFSKFIPECIPQYRIAYSFAEFENAVKELTAENERVCYKLKIDEGATTFRIIDDSIESGKAFWAKSGYKVTSQAARKIVSEYDFAVPILVMPYLSGPEISADCLNTANGMIILPRQKTNNRYSIVDLSSDIIPYCEKALRDLKLMTPFNIQFKYEGDRPYLLEINPRMSGGLQLACNATGINVPNIAANQLFSIHKEWEYPEQKTFKVANIETPICID